jgi:hypothetical protein
LEIEVHNIGSEHKVGLQIQVPGFTITVIVTINKRELQPQVYGQKAVGIPQAQQYVVVGPVFHPGLEHGICQGIAVLLPGEVKACGQLIFVNLDVAGIVINLRRIFQELAMGW